MSRTITCGSPTAAPNVAATPIYMGTQQGDTSTANASYAGLFVYGRALRQPEVGLMYQTVKAKMAARGVVLQ